VSSGAIRGAGDTRWPMVASLLMTWLFFVPCIFVLGRGLDYGIYGAWTGATLHITILGVLLFGRFRRGKWKSMKI
jgi:Na+-driven multidrug efflux pump